MGLLAEEHDSEQDGYTSALPGEKFRLLLVELLLSQHTPPTKFVELVEFVSDRQRRRPAPVRWVLHRNFDLIR